MPDFLFRVSSASDDQELDVVKLENIADARRAAVKLASDLLRDAPDKIWDEEMRVQVSRDDGLILFTILVLAVASPATRM